MWTLHRLPSRFYLPIELQKLLLCPMAPRVARGRSRPLWPWPSLRAKGLRVNVLRVRAEVEAVAPDARAMLAREVSFLPGDD